MSSNWRIAGYITIAINTMVQIYNILPNILIYWKMILIGVIFMSWLGRKQVLPFLSVCTPWLVLKQVVQVFLANSTGTLKHNAVILARAIPLDSIVRILSTSTPSKRLLNSSLIHLMISISIRWFRKPSTLSTSPSSAFPSEMIFSSNLFNSVTFFSWTKLLLADKKSYLF